MEIKVSHETLTFLREALREIPKFSRLGQAERIFRKCLEQGWIFLSDMEDILFILDDRLNDFRIDLEGLYLLSV